MTNKQSFRFFLIMLMLFAVTMCVIGYSMASAFNLSPYTFKLRSRATAADSLYIKGDTLYCNQMAVSLHAVMKAVAVQTDTVRGASTIVGIVDDTLKLDTDSTGTLVTIVFGGMTDGGGLRWNKTTNAMQYTNDFVTWAAIGTGGSSSTNADSLFHIPAFVRPQTDGYVLKFDADGDSLYLAADATGGGSADSNAITYETDRLASYSDSAMYFGDIGDSTMMRFLGDSAIISFAKIYYGEEVVDSALVTYGTLEAAVAALGSGDITGVITSGDWLEGGASSGDVALNIRAIYEDAYQVIEDTTAIEGTAIKLRQPAGYSSVTMVDQAITLQNGSSGSIVLNVDGTPMNTDEMTITENNIEIRSAGSNGVLYLSGYDLERVQFGAIGTMFVGAGTSSAPTFTTIHSILDTLFAIGDAAGDTMWANTPAYLRAVALKDSINATKSHSGVWTLTGNWVNTTNPWADNEVANNLTVDDAGIASTITRDTEAQALIRDSIFANSNAFLKAVALKDSINATKAHSGVWTLTGNWVNTTNPWADNEVADNITVTGMGDLTDITAGNGLTGTSLTGPSPTINVVVGANGLTVNADSLFVDTTKIMRVEELRANWLIAWADSTLNLGSGAGLTITSSILLGTDITDTIRRDIQIPEYSGVVYPRGYHATDIAAYDSAKTMIRAGHDASGSYVVCIDSLVWATDHSRYAVLGFPMPDGAVRLNRILIQASSAENAVDSGVVWAGLKKNDVDSAGVAFELEDLADRDSTHTSALDTLVLDNTGGLVPESYTEGDVAYVVIRFTTRAGNGRSGVASYYIRKAWAEWVRDQL